MNRKAHVLLEFTSSQKYTIKVVICLSETLQDRDVVTTDH